MPILSNTCLSFSLVLNEWHFFWFEKNAIFLRSGHKIYLNLSIYGLINKLWGKGIYTPKRSGGDNATLCSCHRMKKANEQEDVGGSWYSRSCNGSAVSYPPLQQSWLSSPEVPLHS